MNKVKSIIKNLKEKLNKRHKDIDIPKLLVLIIIVIIIILFGINTYITIAQNNDYNKKVQSGNDRWEQVHNVVQHTEQEVNDINLRLNVIEERINLLEKGGY